MSRVVIDLDSWASDTEPIELRIGRRPIFIRSPSFERALQTADICERVNADHAAGRIDVPRYIHGMTDALLRYADFVGAPNWLGRMAVRGALKRLATPVQLRILQELYAGFAVSLGQWSRAVTGGANTHGAWRETGSPPLSGASAIGAPESFSTDASPGDDSGDWSAPSDASRPMH